MADAVTQAEEHGYVSTLFGRRRQVPEIRARNWQTRKLGERLAVNSIIQGTAADIIKVAMVRCHDALAAAGLSTRVILQIHDELLFEGPEEEAQRAAEIASARDGRRRRARSAARGRRRHRAELAGGEVTRSPSAPLWRTAFRRCGVPVTGRIGRRRRVSGYYGDRMAIADDQPSTMTTSYWHPFADMGAVSQSELLIERGEGVHVFDAEGKRYLDGDGEPVVREPRPRPRATSRAPSPTQMGRLAAYSDVRRLLQPARQRARRAARGARADGRRQGLPRLGRRRRDRHRRQDRPPPLGAAGAARARAHRQPHQRLPRHARVRHVDRRDRGQHRPTGAR